MVSKPIKILADATLPNLVEFFNPRFDLTLFHSKEHLMELLPHNKVLLCRSTLTVNESLLNHHSIECVATASSGSDHIDKAYLNHHHITCFDAKGSNARAVADYVISSIATLKQANKITGNLAGVIGVGEVGTRVVSRLKAAEFNVICYDPIKMQHDKEFISCKLTELMSCNLLCIHANLHKTPPFSSWDLLNADFLAQLNPNVTIINASRGGIVNEDALLSSIKPITYCTDVYLNEPDINPEIINFSTLCTPHIAGHSIEAKHNMVAYVIQKLHRHYGLEAPPVKISISKHDLTITYQTDWQAYALELYNPLGDTKILKQASEKKEAFLVQRNAHKDRHDFNVYKMKNLNQQTKRVLDQS